MPQPQKSLDHSIYIDNNKNISNKSRYSEIFNKNEIDQDKQLLQSGSEQNLKQDLQFTTEESANDQQDSKKPTEYRNTVDPVQVNQALQAVIDRIDYTRRHHVADRNAAVKSRNNKGWFKRKKLADFYPLSQEDADLLRIKSNREFNLDFINKLLLKLAGEYSNHHFGHKKVLLNYMAKALANELRESTKANDASFQFNYHDADKARERYLNEIEGSTDTSKQAQLKRKIIGIFDSDTAYELLSSCSFIGVVDSKYQIRLPQDIKLSEYAQDKLLQQVQIIYGKSVEQLKIIAFTKLNANQHNTLDEKQKYLLQLSKQLNPESVWYKVRSFLIQRYNKYIDFGVLSKLVVVEEDTVNQNMILKSTSAFNDYYVRNRYMQDLAEAFEAQNFTFKLIKFES
ncbi:MAG: hypothetical protein O7C68_04035 [Rickettsia endosymbiont of Ixodes ricinus]|uniref:DnaA N-terminal domain-containing protein n=1 Tax=Rickettsia helvetica TaxID=35789 RepID=A0ABM9ND85_RICHE|nr:hypothetical protein [Rickettsia helvetica]MCZ6884237.1 hypothetical protein [Rickettsia endosymbiont of Ixodes ricinus]MCZ6896759.1 hypothetical protein [Rickettsia endosymbiont of Ixodes ricinus]